MDLIHSDTFVVFNMERCSLSAFYINVVICSSCQANALPTDYLPVVRYRPCADRHPRKKRRLLLILTHDSVWIVMTHGNSSQSGSSVRRNERNAMSVIDIAASRQTLFCCTMFFFFPLFLFPHAFFFLPVIHTQCSRSGPWWRPALSHSSWVTGAYSVCVCVWVPSGALSNFFGVKQSLCGPLTPLTSF